MTANAAFSTQSVTLVCVGRALARSNAPTVIKEHVEVGLSGAGHFAELRTYTYLSEGTTAAASVGGVSIRSRNSDILIFSCGPSGTTFYSNTDTPVTGAAIASATTTGFTVGVSGTNYCAQDFERVLVYNTAISPTQANYLLEGLRRSYAFPIPTTTLPIVLWTGNSIHYGVGANDVINDIPSVAMATLGLPYGSRWIDFSIPGQSTPQCTASDPAKLKPFNNPGQTIVVCWTEITNDIYLYSASAGTAYADVKAYLATVQAVLPTAKIVITTCLPRGGTYTVRNAVNTSLRGDFTGTTAYSYVFTGTASWATNVVLADWAAQPTMGPDGAETNATYYDSLQIHPSNAGVLLLAPITANALTVAGI